MTSTSREKESFPVAWDDPADAGRTWTRWSNEPCAVLIRDYGPLYGREARECFEQTGSPICQSHHVRFVNGYWYMGSDQIDPEVLTARQRRQWDRGQRWVDRGTSLFAAEILPELEGIRRGLRKRRPRSGSLAARVEYMELALTSEAHAMGNLHWHWGPPFSWPGSYSEITGEPPEKAEVLIRGIDHQTSRLIKKLRALARELNANPRLKDSIGTGRYDAASSFPSFERKFDRLLSEFGRRTGNGYGSAVSFTTPTWSIRPATPLEIILSYTRYDLDGLEREEQRTRAARRRAVARIRRKLRGDPERLGRLEFAYSRALREAREHEDGNHLIEQEIFGTMREAIDAVGRKLVAEELTLEADDVFHLSLDELRRANEIGADGLRSIVEARKLEWAGWARLDAPTSIGPQGTQGGGDHGGEGGTPAGSFRGFGASSGRSRGKARVADPSPIAPPVEPGEILVARSLGPDWTPIVPLLSGLVLEDPAVHQHGAILAREFGIPAVIGVKGARARIPPGTLLTVDGSRGEVEVET